LKDYLQSLLLFQVYTNNGIQFNQKKTVVIYVQLFPK